MAIVLVTGLSSAMPPPLPIFRRWPFLPCLAQGGGPHRPEQYPLIPLLKRLRDLLGRTCTLRYPILLSYVLLKGVTPLDY